MTKLLSDEEFKEQLDGYMQTYSRSMKMGALGAATTALNKANEFINTQKRLYAEMIIDIDTDVDIPGALKKIYNDGYSKGYNDRTYENSYNSVDSRMAEAIAPAVAKVRSRYDKQYKMIRAESED